MLVAGLMSGTSADRIDAAIVELHGLGWNTHIRLRAFRSVPYPPQVRRRILEISGGASAPASEISQMNFLLGELFAQACRSVCQRAAIPLQQLRLIGSHGQTIFHQNRPARLAGYAVRSTLQIGEPSVIAERTGVTTIADFRPADIAAGGQGAPLVPFFDYLLYRHPRRGRVALNIGGIANVTAIPAAGKPENVIAFDTGPGNMLLDALVRRLSNGRLSYDRLGALARQGRISEPLVRGLLRQKYFRRPPPKSAGREQFGQPYLERYFFPQFAHSRQGLLDALATATAFTAAAIAEAIRAFILPNFPIHECFVSGGGLKNRFLIAQLDQRLREEARRAGKPAVRILPSDSSGIPADAKEAVAFAVLAYHTYRRQPSNLRAATGARHPAILGKIAYAKT
ncbi:MAG: anhydro-N-acetylmuramic acid kinase [Acidobacteria bacterium]|nr:anhydro-N-acetylmuramic acid kinase [Acidobacteriota bacterium]